MSVQAVVVREQTRLQILYLLLSLYRGTIIPRILLVNRSWRSIGPCILRVALKIRVAHLVRHLVGRIIAIKPLDIAVHRLLPKYPCLVVLVVVNALAVVCLLKSLLIKLLFKKLLVGCLDYIGLALWFKSPEEVAVVL